MQKKAVKNIGHPQSQNRSKTELVNIICPECSATFDWDTAQEEEAEAQVAQNEFYEITCPECGAVFEWKANQDEPDEVPERDNKHVNNKLKILAIIIAVLVFVDIVALNVMFFRNNKNDYQKLFLEGTFVSESTSINNPIEISIWPPDITLSSSDFTTIRDVWTFQGNQNIRRHVKIGNDETWTHGTYRTEDYDYNVKKLFIVWEIDANTNSDEQVFYIELLKPITYALGNKTGERILIGDVIYERLK